MYLNQAVQVKLRCKIFCKLFFVFFCEKETLRISTDYAGLATHHAALRGNRVTGGSLAFCGFSDGFFGFSRPPTPLLDFFLQF